MSRSYGLLCPEGHGLLLERDEWAAQGVAWCPSSEHGGNGRMYRLQEVTEGFFDPDKPRAKSAAQIELEQRAAAKAAERQELWMAKTTAKPKGKPAPRARAGKEPKACLCGCGGMTKGGRFLPGHDARYHAAEKAAAAAAAGAAAQEGDQTFGEEAAK